LPGTPDKGHGQQRDHGSKSGCHILLHRLYERG
jgi:hypothetical protein